VRGWNGVGWGGGWALIGVLGWELVGLVTHSSGMQGVARVVQYCLCSSLVVCNAYLVHCASIQHQQVANYPSCRRMCSKSEPVDRCNCKEALCHGSTVGPEH
jgi:hypothetical protein